MSASLTRTMRPATAFAATAVVLTTVAAILLEAASIGGGLSAVDFPLGKTLLMETSVGHAMLTELITSVALATAVVAKSPRLVVGLAGLMLYQLTSVGHGAGIGIEFVEAVHILCGCAWLGALVPFVLALKTANLGVPRCDVSAAMRRFSLVGHSAVAGAITGGLATAGSVAGGRLFGLSFRYGSVLAIKVIAVGAMAALAVVNRYVLVPRIRTNVRSPLAINAATEVPLGLIAIASVALLGIADDPH
ncbi:CopD family protein (plasmid) [Rhizobium sp. T1473]|uniref:CopD family protein n=1 Tax=Rhizobium sp. T1473 TaxID=555321 RepID=UPI001AC4DA67|nr:CopD family protein [Rhizobium sp. T1473]